MYSVNPKEIKGIEDALKKVYESQSICPECETEPCICDKEKCECEDKDNCECGFKEKEKITKENVERQRIENYAKYL